VIALRDYLSAGTLFKNLVGPSAAAQLDGPAIFNDCQFVNCQPFDTGLFVPAQTRAPSSSADCKLDPAAPNFAAPGCPCEADSSSAECIQACANDFAAIGCPCEADMSSAGCMKACPLTSSAAGCPCSNPTTQASCASKGRRLLQTELKPDAGGVVGVNDDPVVLNNCTFSSSNLLSVVVANAALATVAISAVVLNGSDVSPGNTPAFAAGTQGEEVVLIDGADAAIAPKGLPTVSDFAAFLKDAPVRPLPNLAAPEISMKNLSLVIA
jgi:hypothetical protein